MTPAEFLAWHRACETDGDEYASLHTRVYQSAPTREAPQGAPNAITVENARREAAPAHDPFSRDPITTPGLPGVAIRFRNHEPPASIALMARQAG